MNWKSSRDTLRLIEDLLRSTDVNDGVARAMKMSSEDIVWHVFEYVTRWAANRLVDAQAMPDAPATSDFNWRSPPPP